MHDHTMNATTKFEIFRLVFAKNAELQINHNPYERTPKERSCKL